MKTRIIAAVVLLPLLLLVVLALPKIFTALLFGALAAIGVRELLSGTGLVKQPRLCVYGMIMAAFIAIWSNMWSSYPLLFIGIAAFAVVLFAEMLLSFPAVTFESVAITATAGGLVPFLLCALVRMHSWTNGRFLILMPFVIAFLSDTGAYFAGLAFGKHKLAPVISPKKTVEGLFGGVIGAIIGLGAYCYVLQRFFGFSVNYMYLPVYGILGSLGAVFGDLSFSAIKRQTGIKDYGNLIPGHGGVLDRFDSVIMTAPVLYYIMLFLIK